MIPNRLYYRIKPLVPWALKMRVRRWFAERKRARFAETWPISPGSEKPPAGWPGWPQGKQFALVLTHDVEDQVGLDRCRQLMQLEMELGFRSCFNFIPEGSYRVPAGFRAELVSNGFEVGIHDLYHNGKLFHSRRGFREHAKKINRYLLEWNAVGFRAGFMLNELDWLHDLNIQYDCSTFDTDPFEPQPQGQQTIFPFWIPNPELGHRHSAPTTTGPRAAGSNSLPRTGYVELPYTLPQDSTLFLLFRERTTGIWNRKLDWIVRHGGMVLLDTHPDYATPEGVKKASEYPIALYEELLRRIRSEYAGAYWHALPREVAGLVRQTPAPASSARPAPEKVDLSGSSRKSAIWVDLDNTPHVPFFVPIVRELTARGYDVRCTAREGLQVCELAARAGLPVKLIGRHGGRNKIAKLGSLWARAFLMLPFARNLRPALALSHGSRSQIAACRMLNIPTVLLEDYEHAVYPPTMRPRWEIVPEVIDDGGLCCPKDRARRYPGLKEHVYAADFRPDASILAELGLKAGNLIVTVRPPATEAHYHNRDGEALFFDVMDYLLRDSRMQIVLLPRNRRQGEWLRASRPAWFSEPRIVFPRAAVDGLNLLFHSDLVVSGGGTMNREAAALRVPAYSILRGSIGAVDRALEQEGLLTFLESSRDLETKLKLQSRTKIWTPPASRPPALDQILAHIEEIIALESIRHTWGVVNKRAGGSLDLKLGATGSRISN